MLRLTDLPHGWTQTGTKVTTTTSETLIPTIAPCLGVTAPSQAGVPSRTRTFNVTNNKTGSFTLFEGVARFPKASAATATWAVISNTKMPACTATAFTDHLSATPTFKKTGLTVSPAASSSLVSTKYGSGTISFGFHYSVMSQKGIHFTTRYLYVAVHTGDYLVQLIVTGLNPPKSVVRKFVTAAEKRIS
jgi:hypothetical protein